MHSAAAGDGALTARRIRRDGGECPGQQIVVGIDGARDLLRGPGDRLVPDVGDPVVGLTNKQAQWVEVWRHVGEGIVSRPAAYEDILRLGTILAERPFSGFDSVGESARGTTTPAGFSVVARAAGPTARPDTAAASRVVSHATPIDGHAHLPAARTPTVFGCPEHHADERDCDRPSKLLSRPVLHPATRTNAGSSTRHQADL
jgi:hypothetical protein